MRGRHFAWLHQPRAHHPGDRRDELGVDQFPLQHRQLRLAGVQLRLGLGDVLAPWSDHFKLIGLALGGRLGLGGVPGGLGVVDVLAADGGLTGGGAPQAGGSFVLAARLDRVGDVGREGFPGLGDLLRPVAGVQPGHRRRLRGGLGRELVRFGSEPADIKAGQHLPFGEAIPLLDQHRLDAIAVVERQLDLAQIDIAEQGEAIAWRPWVQDPPCRTRSHARRGGERYDQPSSFRHEPARLVVEHSLRAWQGSVFDPAQPPAGQTWR